MKKLLLLAAILLLASCSSYKVGRISHPQIKTVAIGKIGNTSDEPRAAFFLRDALRQQIMLDGTLQLVDADKADVIITGTIPSYNVRVVGSTTNEDRGQREESYRAYLYRAYLPFNYSITTRQNDFLVQKKTAKGYSDFNELLDLEVQKREAIRRAALQSAKLTIQNITEAW